jgi:hypothetical protein
MNWKETFQSARDSGPKVFEDQFDLVIKQQWPKIQTLFQEKVGPAALAAANDDHKMEILFKVVYQALPFPLHLAVKEEAFVKFCFAHRDQLLPRNETPAQSEKPAAQ